MEIVSFVEKEPSKVAVRFIGQTLHYKRNHLPSRAEITAIHHKQSTLIKACRVLLHLHLIYFSPHTRWPTQSLCKVCKGSHTGTAAFERHWGLRSAAGAEGVLRSPDAHTPQHRCRWTPGMSNCARCFQDYQFLINFLKVQVHDAHEKRREKEWKKKFREL